MVSIRRIKRDFDGNLICRRCINRIYNAKLIPSDCVYSPGEFDCAACGQRRNIVVGLRITANARMAIRKAGSY